MVDAVAGETTNINANIVFSAGITLSATGNIAQFFKGSQQRRTIKELRKRTQDLEAQLGLKPADGNR
jgi:hypothetical protein